MNFKKIIFIFIVLMCSFGFTSDCFAVLNTVPSYTVTDSVISSDNPFEYYEVRTPLDEDNVIYVSGKTKVDTKRFAIRMKKHGSNTYAFTVFVTPSADGEFSIKINTEIGNSDTPEVIDSKGEVATSSDCFDTRPGYRAIEAMEPGVYHLTIARAVNDSDADISPSASVKWYNGPLGGSVNGYAYKEFLLSVNSDNNNPKLITYNNAIKNNQNLRNLYESKTSMISTYNGSYVRYKDTYLKDIAFVLKNPKTGVTSSMVSSKVNYLKSIANRITANCSNNYEKVLSIYEYVSGNFYYDRLAFEKSKYQFANPYENIYNFENKIASDNSDSNGNVATTCQGYASMVVALSRSLGIPSRLVHGHHISSPINIWSDKTDSDIQKSTHWWAEVWVNNKWITVDANSGTIAKWQRSSFDDAGSYENPGLNSYVGFDPSDEVLANTYLIREIYKGSTSRNYIAYKNESDQLKSFLNKTSSGIKNGKRLNSKYSSTSYSTWGTTSSDSIVTDGYGRIAKLSFPSKKVYGALNLSNYKSLKYAFVYTNKITSINLTNCSNLISLNANYNSLTTLNSVGAPNLTTISLIGNKLTNVKFKYGSKTVTIKRNITKGSFGFKYVKANSKKVTICAASAPKGYKYLGIYSYTGKRLSSKKTFSFNPTANTYYVKYKKK